MNTIISTGLKSKYTPIEKVSGVYIVRWGFSPVIEKVGTFNEETEEMEYTGEESETDYAKWCSCVMKTYNLQAIKDTILGWYNENIDKKILEGFVWNEMSVWLSTENQFNYKAAYDLAVQTGGMNLPIKFKFGTTDEPVYHTFETLEELSDFYVKAMTYINTCLEEGWIEKDSINWEDYKIE